MCYYPQIDPFSPLVSIPFQIFFSLMQIKERKNQLLQLSRTRTILLVFVHMVVKLDYRQLFIQT